MSLNPGQRAFDFRLDGSDGLAIHIKQVVCEANPLLHDKFAHHYTSTSGEVEFVTTLYQPTGGDKVIVDFQASFLLWCLWHGNSRPIRKYKMLITILYSN